MLRHVVSTAMVLGLIASLVVLEARVGGGDITFKVKSAGNVTFSHENHVVGYELRCTHCHDSLFLTRAKHRKVTMAQMQKGVACGACHNGKRAFSVKGNCNTCHSK
jgi:c(7)-type cytochrome triheme protein